jgi:hypothetical protein
MSEFLRRRRDSTVLGLKGPPVRTRSNRHRSFATRRLTHLHKRRPFVVATPPRRKCRDPILAHRWWPAEASRRTDLAAGLDAPLSLTDDPKRRGNRTYNGKTPRHNWLRIASARCKTSWLPTPRPQKDAGRSAATVPDDKARAIGRSARPTLRTVALARRSTNKKTELAH